MDNPDVTQVISMFAGFLAIGLSLFLLFLLAACRGYLWLSGKNRAPQFSMARTTFFNGQVLAEYFRSDQTNCDDYLTLTFYHPGTYAFAFSLTPRKPVRLGRGEGALPPDFELNVEKAPMVHIISQAKLPDYLQVAIICGAASEDYDFA
jgi:hypothetical protein